MKMKEAVSINPFRILVLNHLLCPDGLPHQLIKGFEEIRSMSIILILTQIMGFIYQITIPVQSRYSSAIASFGFLRTVFLRFVDWRI